MYRYLVDGAQLAARSAATPAMFGMRWIADWDRRTTDWLIPSWSDLLLQIKVAADEIFFASELMVGANIGAFLDGHRVRAEVESAIDLFAEKGWIDEPEGYHRTPTALVPTSIARETVRGLPFEHLTFDSGFEKELILTPSHHHQKISAPRGPQTKLVRHYRLKIDGVVVHEETNNILRKRVHRLPEAVAGHTVEVECLATHGAPVARIFEARAYAD